MIYYHRNETMLQTIHDHMKMDRVHVRSLEILEGNYRNT